MKKILILLIRFYQKYLSPMKRTRCPYYPTCSNYGLQAIEKHGAIKGSILAIWRILRCNPFSHGGIDLVPEKFISFNRKCPGQMIRPKNHGQLGGKKVEQNAAYKE